MTRNEIACAIRDAHDWPESPEPWWPIFLKAADAIAARALASAPAGLRELTDEILRRIEGAHRSSIGSLNNVLQPVLTVDCVKEWRERYLAALAPPSQPEGREEERPRCGLCRVAIPLPTLAAGKGILGGNAFICEDCADTSEGWEYVMKIDALASPPLEARAVEAPWAHEVWVAVIEAYRTGYCDGRDDENLGRSHVTKAANGYMNALPPRTAALLAGLAPTPAAADKPVGEVRNG